MKQDFLNYIQETFDFDHAQMQDFQTALKKPLKKTIRINTNKIGVDDFRKRVEKKGWILTLTPL